MKLSGRLSAVAEMAGSGESVIDVGTDHGYVPVFLRLEGRFVRIAASDIRPGPLDRARRSAAEYGAEDIEFYLSDGLRDVDGPFGTVILAGMGGETMVSILSACHWISGSRLVLQPQSKVRELSEWLDGSGFVCTGAKLVEDGGRLYPIFTANHGEGRFQPLTALLAARDPLLVYGLTRERHRLTRAVEGLQGAGRAENNVSLQLRQELETILNVITEVENW